MTMTIMAAAAEVGSLGETDMETLAKAISSGSLRGARGNSGVILSQLLRGFTKSVQKSENLDAAAIRCALSDNADAAARTAAAHTMYDRVFHNRLQCEFRQFTGRTAAVTVHLERNTFTEPQLLQGNVVAQQRKLAFECYHAVVMVERVAEEVRQPHHHVAGDSALLLGEDGQVYRCQSSKGTLVNSVGAGDSMVAGFLAGFEASKGDLQEALKMGISAGSASAFHEWLATEDDIKEVYATL